MVEAGRERKGPLDRRVHTFDTKVSYSTKNYVHMAKSSRIRRLKMVIFEKKTIIPDICQWLNSYKW